jgi:hypothetical protein
MTFKILTLDGGGMRGIISARILKEFEQELKALTGKEIHEYFDLVAGTSTGSILAAGVAMKKPIDTMIGIYLNEGGKIFPEDKRKLRNIIPGGGGYVMPFTQYPTEGLKSVLKDQLKNESGQLAKMREIRDPILMILAYDTWSRNTTYFASDRDDESGWFLDNELWEICMCSAAAPTYFPPHQLTRTGKHQKDVEYPHIDGGVAANNPSLAALCHAMLMQNIGLEDIAILSIGTGITNHRYKFDEVKKWGLLNWAQQIPDIFMAGPSEFQEGVAAQIMGFEKSGRYLRLNYELNGKLATDGKKIINEYSNEHLNEAMDDPTQCQSYLEVTEKYLNSSDKQGKPIKEKIREFIQRNPVA